MSITEWREERGSAFLDPGDALDAASLRLDHNALVHGGREPEERYVTPKIHPSMRATTRSAGARQGLRKPARLPSRSARRIHEAAE